MPPRGRTIEVQALVAPLTLWPSHFFCYHWTVHCFSIFPASSAPLPFPLLERAFSLDSCFTFLLFLTLGIIQMIISFPFSWNPSWWDFYNCLTFRRFGFGFHANRSNTTCFIDDWDTSSGSPRSSEKRFFRLLPVESPCVGCGTIFCQNPSLCWVICDYLAYN